jgi:hypothetical protein
LNGCILAGKNCPAPIDFIYHFTSLESPLSFDVGGAYCSYQKNDEMREKEAQMKTKTEFVWALLLGALLFVPASGCMAADEITPDVEELCLIDFQKIPRMSIDDLKSRLGDSSLVIIDVRAIGDWNGSSIKIKGAHREVYADTEKWASNYDKQKTIILYCA